MTREEQIEKAWLAFAVQSIHRYDEKTFKEAIKWADEHPNLYNDEKYQTVKVSCLDELYRKSALYDTFLEKSCKYLKSLVYQEFEGGPLERTFSDEDIEEFKKVMEK